MNNPIQKRCDLLADNLQKIDKISLFDNKLMNTISAAVFVEKEKEVNLDRLKKCLKLIKQNEGVFSSFRGDNMMIIASKMSMKSSPELYLDDCTEIYQELKKKKLFNSSEYGVITASIICDFGKINEVKSIVKRTESLVDGMKAVHPFLSADSAICFANVLAMTDKKVDDILTDIETGFKLLKEKIKFPKHSMYSLAMVIAAYGGTVEEKVNKVVTLLNALYDAGLKYGKEYELASLGMFVSINSDVSLLVKEIKDTDAYLKTKKGFRTFDIDKEIRLMFAAMMVECVYSLNEINVDTSVISGTIARVVAEETALVVGLALTGLVVV